MSYEAKTISRDTYLKALGMFTIANQFYKEARDIQLRLADFLGEEDGSHIDDAIYSGDIASVRDFDAALKKASITVEPEAPELPNGDQGGAA